MGIRGYADMQNAAFLQRISDTRKFEADVAGQNNPGPVWLGIVRILTTYRWHEAAQIRPFTKLWFRNLFKNKALQVKEDIYAYPVS